MGGISSFIAVVLVVAAIVSTALIFCVCQRVKKKSPSVVKPDKTVVLTAIMSAGGEEIVTERESEECDSLSNSTTTTAEIHSIPVSDKSSSSTNPESPSPSNRSTILKKPTDPPPIRVWNRKPSLPRPISGNRRRSSSTSASSLEEDQMPLCNPIAEDSESPLGPKISKEREGSDSKRERQDSKITEKHCIPQQSLSNKTFSLTQRSASRRRSSTTSTGSTLEAEKLIPNSPLAQVAHKAGSQVDDDSD